MEHVTIREVLSGWDVKDLTNLWAILERNKNYLRPKREGPTVEEIEEKIKWLYHSRSRAETEVGCKKIKEKINGLFHSRPFAETEAEPKKISSDDIRSVPRYDQLIVEASKYLKVYEKNASLELSQVFILEAIVIEALKKMSPWDRNKFFTKTISIDNINSMGNIKKSTGIKTPLAGPVTVFAALGMAQASGFGIYVASTTVLGILTHALGITLPFAVYTGLTSTIAIVIGPVGWLAAGGWFFWKLTGIKWEPLLPALVYIFSANARRKLEAGN